MRRMQRSRERTERGAVLVHVALSILMLIGFSVFVLDNGVVLVSRGQAQNSADGGALAGAVSLAFDDPTYPPPAGGIVEQAATNVAQDNAVWNAPGAVAVSYECPPGVSGGGCVRVDVFRNGENGSATLPVFFGPLLGIVEQGVRATATAQVAPANATNCLAPWAVGDRWWEPEGWTQQSTYEPANGEYYIPPYSPATTGFIRADANGNPVDVGYQLTLKIGNPGQGGQGGGQSGGSPGQGQTTTYSSGWAMMLDLPNDCGGGASNYRCNLLGCTTATIGIAAEGETCTAVNTEAGCLDVFTGAAVGPTRTGVRDIVARDPGASWGANGPEGGNGGWDRVVPVAAFDPDLYLAQNCSGTQCILKLVGIIGFFVEGLCGDGFPQEEYLDCSNPNSVVGRLVSFPGTYVAGAGETADNGAFGQFVGLVR